jgi:hypothetical protein
MWNEARKVAHVGAEISMREFESVGTDLRIDATENLRRV